MLWCIQPQEGKNGNSILISPGSHLTPRMATITVFPMRSASTYQKELWPQLHSKAQDKDGEIDVVIYYPGLVQA